ncbi:DUF3307 domain-containing protein [uncultured Flavobacterium sp.]|uniref:DUF3307 domain-containing protein n=1 Tax=uncultured Flavobacterium sp. TaxID=165435 RepID=UPI0030CA2A36
MMLLFTKLLLAHLIGDFILQPNKWVSDKEKKKEKSIYLYLHTALHLALMLLFVSNINFIIYGVFLAISHGIIDFIKLKYQKKKTKHIWFSVDQLLHLILIFVIVLAYNNTSIDFQNIDNRIWIFITGLVLLTKPTSIIIKNIISIWTPESKNKEDQSLQNAGNYIGILERLFVFCFILTNHFEAIGFLLAAKSIFRFGDLKEGKDRKLTEYVLIGTLLSFGIAILVGLLVEYGTRISFY